MARGAAFKRLMNRTRLDSSRQRFCRCLNRNLGFLFREHGGFRQKLTGIPGKLREQRHQPISDARGIGMILRRANGNGRAAAGMEHRVDGGGSFACILEMPFGNGKRGDAIKGSI